MRTRDLIPFWRMHLGGLVEWLHAQIITESIQNLARAVELDRLFSLFELVDKVEPNTGSIGQLLLGQVERATPLSNECTYVHFQVLRRSFLSPSGNTDSAPSSTIAMIKLLRTSGGKSLKLNVP